MEAAFPHQILTEQVRSIGPHQEDVGQKDAEDDPVPEPGIRFGQDLPSQPLATDNVVASGGSIVRINHHRRSPRRG